MLRSAVLFLLAWIPMAHADDEKWTQLISATQGAADPAVAAMTSLLKAQLTPKPAPKSPHVHTYTIIKRR